MVVFGHSGCIQAKVLLIGQKFLYSGKSGFLQYVPLYSRKSGCSRAK